MKFFYLLLLNIFLSISASATSIPTRVKCTAKIALNRVFTGEVDRVTRELMILSDTGSTWEGNASKYTSKKTGSEFYNLNFLKWPSTQPEQLAVEISLDGEHAICLSPSECYLCK